jgi:hypothetical protein
MSSDQHDVPTTPSPATVADQVAARTFSQAELDAQVRQSLRGVQKPEDYDEVKARAETVVAQQRRAEALEEGIARLTWLTMRNELAAAHRVPAELRDEFMVAEDATTLEAQADRLGMQAMRARTSGNIAPREGTIPAPADESDREVRDYVRGLFDVDQ